MKYLALYIAALACLTISCQNGLRSTSLSQVSELLSHQGMDSSDFIVTVFYTPYDCVNCNLVLSKILNNEKYEALWQKNAFLIYPGIRKIEEKDNSRHLLEMGGINLRPVNNKKTYDRILKLANVSFDGKPFLIIFSRYWEAPYILRFKEDPKSVSKLDSIASVYANKVGLM